MIKLEQGDLSDEKLKDESFFWTFRMLMNMETMSLRTEKTRVYLPKPSPLSSPSTLHKSLARLPSGTVTLQVTAPQ